MENRRKPAPPATTLDINCDCKEYVIDYLAKSFPVRLMAVFTDENGNPRSEPMSDEQGAPVLCRSALAARDRMIEQLCALPPIATALDAIIERFSAARWVSNATRRCPPMTLSRPSWRRGEPWNSRAARSSWSNAAWSMAHSDLNSRDGALLGSTGTRPKAALPRSSVTRPGSSCRSKAQQA